jgi:hypothetical protein
MIHAMLKRNVYMHSAKEQNASVEAAMNAVSAVERKAIVDAVKRVGVKVEFPTTISATLRVRNSHNDRMEAPCEEGGVFAGIRHQCSNYDTVFSAVRNNVRAATGAKGHHVASVAAQRALQAVFRVYIERYAAQHKVELYYRT